MRKIILVPLIALAGCAPSVSRRQCEFIGTHGPAAVAKRYNWAGYYDCQGSKALVPVLVYEHLDLGVFSFKKERVIKLLGRDVGGSTIGGSKPQWMLSPNEKFVIWVEVQIGGPMLLIGPHVRVYPLDAEMAFVVKLPPRSGEGMVGTWQFEGFSKDGNQAIFYVFGKGEKAIIDLPKGKLALLDENKNQEKPN